AMKATLLVAPKQIEIGEVDEPRVATNEVLIQPARVGVCGSDVSFYLGHRTVPYPFVLGHEVVGHVTALGNGVTNFEIGQRVIVEPNYPCGACTFCRSGRGAICPNKKSLGVSLPGCFADAFVAPAEFAWHIPDGISDEDAVVIEPLAVSLHALLHSGARMGDTIAVIGCGATGLLLIHAAVAQGIRVLAHDKFADKLALARQLGAVMVVESGDVAQLWRDESVTTVFECAGASVTVELALSAAPRGSAVVLIGLSTAPASFVPLRLVREGIRVSGSLIYDHPADFARAIALVKHGTLCPSQIVTETLPFDQMDRALQLASTGQSGKVVVTM
ncbi:MAG: alcohol dehydrogenase catalytic domain-containing protein, partial [Anaerolineales bacterium]|nr:alcohol dehydrogenase catalytic domain-containing protein [Anaerolineales bacterium]